MDERAFRDDTTVEIEFIIIMSNEKCSSLPICVKFASELFCFFGTSTSAFVGSFNWLSFFLSSVSNIFFLSFSFETAAGRDCSWMQLIYAYKILVSSSPSFLLSLRLFFSYFCRPSSSISFRSLISLSRICVLLSTSRGTNWKFMNSKPPANWVEARRWQ